MNLANRITVARIILMPVVVFFMLAPFHVFEMNLAGQILTGSQLIALVLFVIATSSDGLDGYIARKWHMITNFGKFMDPLADKLLVCAVLIAFVEMHRVPSWIAIVIISRELAVTGLRAVAADEGLVIAAGTLGKWKTRLQMVALIAMMLQDIPFSYIGVPFDQIMLYLATLMTVISGVDYFVRNRHVLQAKG